MRPWPPGAAPSRWPLLTLSLMLLAAAGCEGPATAPAADTSGEVRSFTGSWTATGTRKVLRLGEGHEAAIFSLSGTILLTGKERIEVGFRGEAMGFSDNLHGLWGSSVWTDERGHKVFSDVHGEGIGPGRLIEGQFTGGTGRYAGISGEYSLRWQHLLENEDGEVSGRAVDVRGWARLADPAVPSAGGRP